jgi:uncharacterized cupin superfamily protein
MWSAWQPDRSMNFNSYFVTGAENVLVDPLPCDDATIALLQSLGGVAWIVLTNRDHERASRVLATAFDAKIAAPALDVPQLSAPVDRALQHDDTIGPLRVIALAGMKSPGECALYNRERSFTIVGDALLGDPVGSLRMLPVEKLGDATRAVLSLRSLRALQPTHLLTGDGAPIFHEASAAIDRYLRSRTDVLAARVNLDELAWRTVETDPAPFDGVADAEVGYVIGASKLGYRVARLKPGSVFCPFHWHVAEEELFYVMEGDPVVRTPGGEYQCRAGDFIAFPTDAGGAHLIRNDGKNDALVLMVSNVDERDVCSYPDSDKILFEREGLIVRRAPALEYFDGEVG